MKTALVCIESPYQGDVARNLDYARRCVADCIARGESPYASHLLYTDALDDTVPEQRAQGLELGFLWGDLADKRVVYTDLGISEGMLAGIMRASENCQATEFRSLGQRMRPSSDTAPCAPPGPSPAPANTST